MGCLRGWRYKKDVRSEESEAKVGQYNGGLLLHEDDFNKHDVLAELSRHSTFLHVGLLPCVQGFLLCPALSPQESCQSFSDRVKVSSVSAGIYSPLRVSSLMRAYHDRNAFLGL